MHKKNNNDESKIKRDYFDKIQEWQDHQYDPGYYTGGNMPPIVSNNNHPIGTGVFMLSTAMVLTLIIIRLLTVEGIFWRMSDFTGKVLTLVILVPLNLLEYVAGITFIKKGLMRKKAYKENKKNKKRRYNNGK